MISIYQTPLEWRLEVTKSVPLSPRIINLLM